MKKLFTFSITFLVVLLLLISGNITSSQAQELTTFTKEDWVEAWSGGFGRVKAVAYSPDGSKLAIGGDAADISIISVSTYELECQLIGHRDRVRCAVWSQDGNKIIAGSDDGTVKIWSATTGEELKTLPEHYGTITALALSPNQKYLATGTGRYERIVRVFDYETGGLLKTFTGFNDAITALVFSYDSEKLACAVGNPDTTGIDSIIKIFELTTGKLLATIRAHEDGVEAIDWSLDGNYICSGGQDETIKIWDAYTYESIATLTGHEGRVNKVLWSREATRILSCSDDRTIKLWDVNKKEVLKNFIDDARVKAIDFSKDETRFASGSDLCKVKIWNLERTSAPERELYEHTDRVRAVDFSPDGTKIASGGEDYTIRIWSAQTGKRLKVIETGAPVMCLDWSPDGSRIVSGDSISMIKLWDAYTGALLNTWKGSDWGWINDVEWSPDYKYIASASNDGRGEFKGLRVWYPNGTLKCLLRGHAEIVNSVSWAPNGTFLVSGSDDRTLRVWDVEKEEQIYYVFYPDSFFCSCEWSPDGGKIAGGTYSSLRVYDSQLNFITSLGPFNRYARAVDWWQDNDKLAVGSDCQFEIWSVSDCKKLSSLPVPLTSSDYIYGIKWHPDNKIVSCEWSSAVRLWRPAIGIEVSTKQRILSNAQIPLEIRC
ncbi:MAG: WD40 repeat domain-containing protein, partial [Candidatus Thermoplasmatota archaeon]